MQDPNYLTIGAAARRCGCPPWRIRRLFERGLLPPAPRVGAYRVIAVADLPVVERALRDAGYLLTEKEVENVR
jgi:DNA-binding transcriptional MerR regulator